MEYLLENLEWFQEKITGLLDQDYILFDCPGQLELYSHLPVMSKIVECLTKIGFSLCSVCLIDATFLDDDMKFVSGILMSLSFMVTLGLPHLSVLSKCDLVKDKDSIKSLHRMRKGVVFDSHTHVNDEDAQAPAMVTEFDKRFGQLKEQFQQIVNDYDLVSLLPLNVENEETIYDIIYNADMCIQYLEAQEPQEENFEMAEEYMNRASGGMGE
jgi:hypothetical protein